MSFNCDAVYRFKVTICLCFVYMYVYKIFCCCVIFWFLWYLYLEEIPLPVCLHLCMYRWKILDHKREINFVKLVTFSWIFLQKYKDTAMTQAVSRQPITARPKFIPRPVRVRFVVIKITMGRFSPSSLVSTVNIIPLMLCALSFGYHWWYYNRE